MLLAIRKPGNRHPSASGEWNQALGYHREPLYHVKQVASVSEQICEHQPKHVASSTALLLLLVCSWTKGKIRPGDCHHRLPEWDTLVPSVAAEVSVRGSG